MFNFKRDTKELSGFFNRIYKKDFSGETGIALKNSSYQLLISLFMKIGSLIFTIIMARILLPEKMGLYSLALSTIVFFSAFSDLGLTNAIMAYIPQKISEKKENEARGYFSLFLRWKLYLLLIVSLVLMIFSYFISHTYYRQPIFYALLVGGLYLFSSSILNFYEQLFKSLNNFKTALIKEIIFQGLRLFLIPLAALFMLSTNLSDEILLFTLFLLLSLFYLIAFFFLFIKSKHEISFFKNQPTLPSKEEIKNLKKFLTPLIITSLSGVFFGYIDIIMLGRYVQSEFISYYTSAFNLISSAGVIISFISVGVFPLLSFLQGNKLESVFKKAIKYSFLIALISSVLVLIFSNPIISLLYGKEYLNAAIVLRYYSILILIFPLISVYENYFVSQKKTRVLANLLIVTTLINIVFNFVFIKYGLLHFGQMGGLLGACFATLISRIVYFFGLVIKKKKVKISSS
jgi:O-antigen/teichoic acid export membrane protein